MTMDSQRQQVSRWSQLFFYLLMFFAAAPALGTSPVQIELLLSDDDQYSRQLTTAFQAALTRACDNRCSATPRIRVSHVGSWQSTSPRDLLVSIGGEAALHAIVSHPKKLIVGLIPQAMWTTLARIHPSLPGNVSAVFLDQSINRQFKFMTLTLPSDRRRVGVLLGPDSIKKENELREAAALYNMSITIRHVHTWEEVGPTMEGLIGQIDVLLAEPDSVVFNPNTLYGILLISYGAGVPVIGYSEALVQAGAMLSLYTSIEDMARHLAQTSAEFILADGVLPADETSRFFSISVNENVSRSLDFNLPGPSELQRLLESEDGLDAASQTAK